MNSYLLLLPNIDVNLEATYGEILHVEKARVESRFPNGN